LLFFSVVWYGYNTNRERTLIIGILYLLNIIDFFLGVVVFAIVVIVVVVVVVVVVLIVVVVVIVIVVVVAVDVVG